MKKSNTVKSENHAVFCRTLLLHCPAYYLLTAAFGILGGLLVAFLHGFPSDGLWAVAYFSTSDFGFWMFTTALLVLWSEKRVVACINAGVYIFFMFLVTTVGMSLGQFADGGTPYRTFSDMILHSLPGWLWYSIPPALLCAGLAAVLWNGRKAGFSAHSCGGCRLPSLSLKRDICSILYLRRKPDCSLLWSIFYVPPDTLSLFCIRHFVKNMGLIYDKNTADRGR